MPTDRRIRPTRAPVADRYELQSTLGEGGMGTVWRATDTVLGREVAVKEVDVGADAADSEGRRRRVLREARAAARLNHPGTIAVYDVVEEDTTVYIVMELIDGPTLGQAVKTDGPMTPDQVAALGGALLDALEGAHGQGVVHRDVKPGNVMLLPDGRAKLGDFGIAAVAGDPSVTSTGAVMGSPAYIAPERAEGEHGGPPADIWGLGATLYFAVEGHPPFDGNSALATMRAVVHEDARPAQKAGPLAPILSAMLAKDPTERPSIGELRPQLDTLAKDTTAGPTVVAAPATATITRSTEVTERRAPDPVPASVRPAVGGDGDRRLRRMTVAVIAALAVVAAVAAMTVLRPGDEDAPDQRSQSSASTAAPDRGTDGDTGRAATPNGWTTYTDPRTGYTIAHPKGWQVQQIDSRTDFRDPASSTYLRVDWVQPPGPSPEGAWQQQSRSFAQRYPDYRQIAIDPTKFKGFDAATWEYTYRGAHAINLGFVTDTHGFALNIQSSQSDWDEAVKLFERFKESFKAP